MLSSRFLTLSGMVLIAALSRLLPHPENVTPITAMALFGGACFFNRRMSFVIPFAAMILSDLVIGFHRQIPTVYLSFALTVLIGFALRNRTKAIPITLAALTSSILFFLITNFGVWLWDGMYPKNIQGLSTCFIAALPFFRNMLLGDLFYVLLLFGAFALAQKRFSILQASRQSTTVN